MQLKGRVQKYVASICIITDIQYRKTPGITIRTGLEYHLPIGQDDQKLRFGSVGLRLKHLINPKPNILV